MDPPCPTSEVSCWSGGVRVGRRRLSSSQAHAPARRLGRVSFRRDPSDGQVSAMVDFAIPLPRRGAGAFIVSAVDPSYLITLLPLRLTMSSYLSTMPLVLAVRRAFTDKECRPYLSSLEITPPHTHLWLLSSVDGRTRPPAVRSRRTMTRLGWARFLGIAFLRRFLRAIWDHLLSCSSLGGRGRYRRLKACFPPSHLVAAKDGKPTAAVGRAALCADDEGDSDLVTLKIGLLGDRHTGKTSFLIKYVGDLEEQRELHTAGLNSMDKVLFVRGARIAFSIWDVGGNQDFKI
ncbi:hypothetical protein GW17_00005795 [Ensete ventricosum]|nr:hypothetical protein GW17_00005795 [Ensete ventricosum]